MKGKKKGRVEKHRGNPHGNAPAMPAKNSHNTSDDQLSTSVGPGVSHSRRQKQ